MTPDAAPGCPPIHELLALHRETHAFDGERQIEPADRSAVLEAARRAPSWNDRQPWRFLVCDRFERPAAWQSALMSLRHSERIWAHQAALLIVVCADLEDGGSPGPRALYDTGAAALQLCLEATARNLATHATARFDDARLRDAFGIPTRYACVAVIAVGHRADLGTLGRDLYLRELAVRRRTPDPGRIFDGEWDRPLEMCRLDPHT